MKITSQPRTQYPWQNLEIGKSFQVLVSEDRVYQVRNNLYTLARRQGYRVSVKQQKGGLLVERVK